VCEFNPRGANIATDFAMCWIAQKSVMSSPINATHDEEVTMKIAPVATQRFAMSVPRTLATAITIALISASAIHANYAAATDIKWAANDTFTHATAIAPGKTEEVCGLVDPRQPVEWTFKSDAPLEFNIHRHADKEVIYATKSHLTRELNGTHKPTFAFDWCWMFTNESNAPATISLQLKRQ
jgi:hypothetical protein